MGSRALCVRMMRTACLLRRHNQGRPRWTIPSPHASPTLTGRLLSLEQGHPQAFSCRGPAEHPARQIWCCHSCLRKSLPLRCMQLLLPGNSCPKPSPPQESVERPSHTALPESGGDALPHPHHGPVTAAHVSQEVGHPLTRGHGFLSPPVLGYKCPGPTHRLCRTALLCLLQKEWLMEGHPHPQRKPHLLLICASNIPRTPSSPPPPRARGH